MAVISDSDLQDLADLGTDLALKDDDEILEDIEGTLDSMGGASHTWLPRMDTSTWPVRTTTKCMVVDWRPPSQEYLIANQVVGMQLKKVLLPLGTLVEKSDHHRIKGTIYKTIEPIEDSSYSVFTEAVVVITTLGA